jgi:hypothetical protein
MGLFEKSVCKGGFAVVDMGNDAEISDVLHIQFVTNNFAQRYCIFKGKKSTRFK